MKFKKYLNEYTHYKDTDKNTTTKYKDGNEMASDIQDTIQKIFSKSFVSARFQSNIAPGITLFFALGKDKSEFENGIVHNDPMHHVIHIGTGEFGENGEIPNKIKMDAGIGGKLYVLGKETMSGDRIKLGWRMKNGTPEQIVKTLKDYFTKARKIYDENKERIRSLALRDK
jgi:hypothetical protein